jgi:hypothetical protein
MSANPSFGNIMSRLQGLKNVSGRKVMPGDDFLQDMEPTNIDVEGASSEQNLPMFQNFLNSPKNVPQENTGSMVSPQGYDVRANTVDIPEEPMPQQMPQAPQDTGFLSRLGNGLRHMSARFQGQEMPLNKSIAQTPPIETAQVDAQEGLPPVTASEQVAQEEQLAQSAPVPQEAPPVEEIQQQAAQPPAQQKEIGSYAVRALQSRF